MDRRRVGLVAVALGVLVAANPLYLGVWTAVGNVYAEPVAPVALGPPLGFPGTTATGWGLVVLAAALLVAVRAVVVRTARRVRG